jgi:hypothetical protein
MPRILYTNETIQSTSHNHIIRLSDKHRVIGINAMKGVYPGILEPLGIGNFDVLFRVNTFDSEHRKQRVQRDKVPSPITSKMQ